MVGDAQHADVVEGEEVVLGLAGCALGLHIFHFITVEAELGDEAAEVGVGVIEEAQHVYELLVVEAEAGEVFHGRLATVRHFAEQVVEEFTDGEHQRVFMALLLHANHHLVALFPFLQERANQFGRVLKIGHQRYHGVAVALQHAIEGRSDVPEVAGIQDDLDVRVSGSQAGEQRHGRICRTVVYKHVFIRVLRQFFELVGYGFSQIGHISLFVVTGSKDGNMLLFGFHYVRGFCPAKIVGKRQEWNASVFSMPSRSPTLTSSPNSPLARSILGT